MPIIPVIKTRLPRVAFRHALILLLALCLRFTASYSRDTTPLDWLDDFQSRLEAYALMQTLNVEILGSSSAMNRLLETTTTPFGKVIAPLEPTRQTFSVKLFWSPLPEGWELHHRAQAQSGKTQPLVIPDALFEHQAIVYSRDRKPIAEVHEVYQRQILGFRRTGLR